ncbi:MAG: hypothetical protein P8J86_07125 [Phycisphaerales bacterium]|nr:hypothetical protein [Phycisphaerales bacterium]
MKCTLRSIVAVIVSSFVWAGITSAQTVVYDNMTNPSNHFLNQGGAVWGDTLSLAGTERQIQQFDAMAWNHGDSIVTADITAQLWAGGLGAAPSALLWQQTTANVSLPVGSTPVSFSVPDIVVPDDVTFTIQFTNVLGLGGWSPTMGLAYANPPTVGSSGNFTWWYNANGTAYPGWNTMSFGFVTNNFMARLHAVQAPPTGACCYWVGDAEAVRGPTNTNWACAEMTQGECLLKPQSTYLGDGISCANATCPAIGCCCYINPGDLFWSQSIISESQCAELPSSVFAGIGSTCENTVCDAQGACCYFDAVLDDFTCVTVSEEICFSLDQSTYLGNGSSCETAECCGPCVDPPDDMIAWWPLDDDPLLASGIAAEMINAYDGIPFNATQGQVGKVSESYRFNGVDSAVRAFHDIDIQAKQDFSIDAWIYMDSYTSKENPIVDDRSPGHVGYYFFVHDAHLGLELGDGLGSSPFTSICCSGPLVGTMGWHHVAVTVDRDNSNGVTFYVDGVAHPTTYDPTEELGSLANTEPTLIGHAMLPYTAGTIPKFMGRIDEVEIFNRVLNPTEVAGLANAGCAGKCKDQCGLPPVTPFCYSNTSKTVTITLCNDSVTDHLYLVDFQGLPAGAGCGSNGPTTFTPAGPLPIMVAAQQCEDIIVEIDRPQDLNSLGDTACWQMTVLNLDTGAVNSCEGKLVHRGWFCFEKEPKPATPAVGVVIDDEVIVGNHHEDNTEVFPYRFIAYDPKGQPNPAVRLNGQEAGKPVYGKVVLKPGQQAELPIQFEIIQHLPLELIELHLESMSPLDDAPPEILAWNIRSALPSYPKLDGDANGDGKVDFDDFSILLIQWGACSEPCQLDFDCTADFDNNCFVDLDDFSLLLINFGSTLE